MVRYVVADLHGQYDLYKQIKEYINEDDIVYALGDFGDRGPEPWRTLKAGLDDPQFIYLMGNHDYMLINAIKMYLKEEAKADVPEFWHHTWKYMYDNNPIQRLYMNGGLPTLNEWAQEPKRMEYYQQLRFAPLEMRLAALDDKHFIYLCHAGHTPGWCEAKDIENFVWDRDHFYDRSQGEGHLMIHGHTPIDYLKSHIADPSRKVMNGYMIYSEDEKIDIDNGAHYTGQTVLLNIDTLEGKVFRIKEDISESENQ